VLSTWRFRGSEVLFGIITLGVYTPAQRMPLPWAIPLGKLGLINSTAGLVLVHAVPRKRSRMPSCSWPPTTAA
jgi:glucose/mannose transport system permease protein